MQGCSNPVCASSATAPERGRFSSPGKTEGGTGRSRPLAASKLVTRAETGPVLRVALVPVHVFAVQAVPVPPESSWQSCVTLSSMWLLRIWLPPELVSTRMPSVVSPPRSVVFDVIRLEQVRVGIEQHDPAAAVLLDLVPRRRCRSPGRSPGPRRRRP